MKIQFVKHSCFAVTMPSATLIFDYSRGGVPELDPQLPVYVFISHAHGDHFNPEVIDEVRNYPSVTFIVSSDIPEKDREAMKKRASHDRKFVYVGADERAEFPELTVRTLKSTDEGVAFVIEIDRKKIYFAGDLHWWTWEGESDEAEEAMKQAFIREMDKIKDEHFDLAFLVLDPRQEDRYWWGFDYFMKNVGASHAFPMHSWGKYKLVENLIADPCSETYRKNIIPVHQSGEIFMVEGIDSKPGMV